MARSIFSLKLSGVVGKFKGKHRDRPHVETVGNTASGSNVIHGFTSPKPRGGIESEPVKNIITSFNVGTPFSEFKDNSHI